MRCSHTGVHEHEAFAATSRVAGGWSPLRCPVPFAASNETLSFRDRSLSRRIRPIVVAATFDGVSESFRIRGISTETQDRRR